MNSILITGGLGYIGSHIAVLLLEQDKNVIIFDNLSNSNASTEDSIRSITQKGNLSVVIGDITNVQDLKSVFSASSIESVIHMAGLKAVGESNDMPLEYYTNNVSGSLELFKVMQEFEVRKLIFSSSATVYGAPQKLPISEDHPVGNATNPYGETKVMIERIIEDWGSSNPNLQATQLRYFNPIGAHPSGKIGEDPKGIPNNLLPFVAQVAHGERAEVQIFGDDYDTPDGTGVRDYLHVMDLAEGHLQALTHIKPGVYAYNLGTGEGSSVLDVIKAFEAASESTIPYSVLPRRAGDVASCYADPSKAEAELKWKATRTLAEACADSWNWQQSK